MRIKRLILNWNLTLVQIWYLQTNFDSYETLFDEQYLDLIWAFIQGTCESIFTEDTKFTIMSCFIENNFQYSLSCSLVPFPACQQSRARKTKNLKYEQQKKLRFENAVYIFGPILISAITAFYKWLASSESETNFIKSW